MGPAFGDRGGRHSRAVASGHAVISWTRAVLPLDARTVPPDQAQDVHRAIREQLAALDGDIAEQTRILYGGSMKPDNAAELIAQPDIDGGLIGGASLKAEDFLGICRAA